MYPTLVIMIVTMQDSVLAVQTDNLLRIGSRMGFAEPSHEIESRSSREESPPSLRGTRSAESMADERSGDEKAPDMV